jgi:hypothetical protein
VMSTPILCPRPTLGHFSVKPATTHPRTAEVASGRFLVGKKGGYFVESCAENCRISGTEPQKVRHRVDPQSQDRGKAENPLHFLDFYAIKLAVICTVNLQVPGSSPGRGATEFVADLGLSPATPAGLLSFGDRYTGQSRARRDRSITKSAACEKLEIDA